MVIQSSSRGICQRCRYDLQSLFERGFCGTTPFTKSWPSLTRQLNQTRISRRNFSRAYQYFKPVNHLGSDSVAQNDQSEAADDDVVLAAQAQVIQELERELGKPLEQAIQEDQISADLIAKYQVALDIKARRNVDKDNLVDTVSSLRDTGAPPSEIVRKAKQVYGSILPDGMLNQEETALYKRLYGEVPVSLEEWQRNQQTQDEVVEQDVLISADGNEIDFRPYSQGLETRPSTEVTHVNTRQVAESLGGKVFHDEEMEDLDEDEESSESDRAHPLTKIGKFRTDPKTLFLSQDGFIKPVERVMSKYSNKHLKEMCERTFGGPGLPDSPLTPRSGRSRQQVAIPLDANQNTMGEMEANAFVSAIMPPTYASISSVLVETRKRLGPTWLNNVLSREGGPRVLDAGGAGVGIVAWREIVQAHWDSLHDTAQDTPLPPATKSVVLTGSDGLRHRAAEMLENTTFIPRLPDYVHSRDAPTLEDNRPVQQRKQFDVIIAPHTLFGLKEDWMRKQFVQNLWAMLSDEGGVLILIEKGVPRGFEAIAGAREMLLERYIAVPEGATTHYSKGHMQQLDEEVAHKRQPGMILAPCTNHEKCPMYTAPGLSRGRKDICSFQQRYIRPPFLQRILGAKDRNHDDVDFSYLAVMKGDDLRLKDITTWDHVSDPLAAPFHTNPVENHRVHKELADESKAGFEDLSPEIDANQRDGQDLTGDPADYEQLPTFHQMPRIVYPPLKRRGHVSMDLCTPAGEIERWTIPRSFSRQAYRDARKSKWGDIWALGAKTHVVRNLRLGTPEKQLIGKDGEIIRGKGRGRKERLKIKAMQLLEQHEEEKMDDLMEQRDLMAALDEELESNAGAPQDFDFDSHSSASKGKPSTSAFPQETKPMNNRERKAARRRLREAATTQGTTRTPASAHETDTADLTFKPRPQIPRTAAMATTNVDDEIAIEHALSEWQTSYDQQMKRDQALNKPRRRDRRAF